jgi:hypothetical protein
VKTHTQIVRRRHSSILDVRSFRAAAYGTDHYLVVAKVRERLAVSKQTTHRVHMERYNLKKLKKNVCRILMEKPEGKRPLVTQRRRRVDNIKIDLKR